MFAFVPIEAPFPDEGGEIELDVENPDYEEELAAHRAGLALNPFAKCVAQPTLGLLLTDDPRLVRDPDALCIAAREVVLVVGYPFPGTWSVRVGGGPFTRAALARAIMDVYAEMYANSTQQPVPKLYNVQVDSPRFGVAWHRLEDLVIERVIASGGRLWVAIGS